MKERREYADGEVCIRYGVRRSGSGWVPVFRVNNGPVHAVYHRAMSLEDAKAGTVHFAREIAEQHTGDWTVSLIDVGEVDASQ